MTSGTCTLDVKRYKLVSNVSKNPVTLVSVRTKNNSANLWQLTICICGTDVIARTVSTYTVRGYRLFAAGKKVCN